MYGVRLDLINDFEAWRAAVRPLLLAKVPPEDVVWLEPGEAGLFEEDLPPPRGWSVSMPSAFFDAARIGLCHRSPGRFDLLYRLAFRLQGERKLLERATDPDVDLLTRMNKAVRRDEHKMHAFVRFRALDEAGEQFAAWFEPDHYIVEMVAPFFRARFTGMHWTIVTPYRSVHWNRETLMFGPGGRREDVPPEDALDDAWRAYFSSIFNPARLKISAMTSEMPRKFWRNLPEGQIISPLVRNAEALESEMIARQASEPSIRHQRQVERQESAGVVDESAIGSLAAASKAIEGCTRCPLYRHATQPVFGEGQAGAQIMLIGEQPGDQEDLAGTPFVGPAGQVLNAALTEAGIARDEAYVTNAVKHFKFTPRGKKRLHNRPDAGEISACRFWLDLERELVQPQVLVALGASAARAVLGKAVAISEVRGAPIAMPDGGTLFVTVHPSYLLRIPDREKAADERQSFVADLMRIKAFAQKIKPPRHAA